jgi:peroxin-2
VDLDGGEDEERIFIPAQTDCWGGCRWCYYCIGTELARHAEGVAATRISAKVQPVRGGKEQTLSVEEAPKWDCLRCGGSVMRAWRLGAEPELLALDSERETDQVDTDLVGEQEQ